MRISGFVLTVAPPAHLLLLDHRSIEGVSAFVRSFDRSVLFSQFREVSLTPAAATTTRVRKANLAWTELRKRHVQDLNAFAALCLCTKVRFEKS